jgi:hypothetical protein
MDSKSKPAGECDGIGGDRRQHRRYRLQMELKWKLIRRRRVLDTGTGQMIDVSSGGILFDAGRPLPEGLNVELSISWPVQLNNVTPMQLVANGKIVRSNGRQAATQTVQHEFRTKGIRTEHRNGLVAASPYPSHSVSYNGELLREHLRVP